MLNFVEVSVPILLHLPPTFSSRLQVGILQYVHYLLLKYSPELEGIPVAINKIRVQDPCAVIKYDNPYFHLTVHADLTVWKVSDPNQLICGEINKISGDHIGLIVFETFNASIPASALRKMYFYESFSKKWILTSSSGEEEEKILMDTDAKTVENLEIGQKITFYVDGITMISESQISLIGRLTS